MARSSFLQGAGLFSYSGTNCIRNDYFHNDCDICVDVCPKGAFHIVRNRLTLFENECIACAACIGSCPTEALQIESFDPNTFVMAFGDSQNSELSCKENTPCLGVFDQRHFISMALERSFECDLSHCEECELNKDQKLAARIRSNINKANRFFSQTGVERDVRIKEEKEVEHPRRALFRSAIGKAKESLQERDENSAEALTRVHQAQMDLQEPLKHVHLKQMIRKHIGAFKTTSFDMRSELFTEKSIAFEACTNCGECVQFCPTQALKATVDKQGIVFTSGACIDCGICDDICKTDAIATKDHIDIVNAVYDRSEELVHYEMVMCHECRCPYPYKGGDPICDRCASFTTDFGNMFTLAKDL
jgi:energy-converting hydrogenase A subunit P